MLQSDIITFFTLYGKNQLEQNRNCGNGNRKCKQKFADANNNAENEEKAIIRTIYEYMTPPAPKIYNEKLK